MLGFGKLTKKVFGTPNDRKIKATRSTVEKINALEAEFEKLSDEELIAKTEEFRKRVADGEALDAILPEAFANCREAAKRALGLRAFDTQLLGGIFLHEGNISEMKTGEGKTLMATLAAYLNALPAKGVHVVTVNDYLATRDADWMRPVYEFLGLTVGSIASGQMPEEKRTAYDADITYGTNNEFGFDYLRDNMALRLQDKAQRKLAFAIVDEVDSILIDEARTPLIISGAAQDSSALYKQMNNLIPLLKLHSDEQPGDFVVDEKTRQVELTEDGHSKLESLLEREGLLKAGDMALPTSGPTKVPSPCLTTIRSSHSSRFNASRNFGRDTFKTSASSRSEGNLWPSFNTPETIMVSI